MAKHLQAEMLRAIANDASLANKIQGRDFSYEKWEKRAAIDLLLYPGCEYQFKPREFKEGAWYPVMLPGGTPFVTVHQNGLFKPSTGPNYVSWHPENIAFIGEECYPDFGDKNKG